MAGMQKHLFHEAGHANLGSDRPSGPNATSQHGSSHRGPAWPRSPHTVGSAPSSGPGSLCGHQQLHVLLAHAAQHKARLWLREPRPAAGLSLPSNRPTLLGPSPSPVTLSNPLPPFQCTAAKTKVTKSPEGTLLEVCASTQKKGAGALAEGPGTPTPRGPSRQWSVWPPALGGRGVGRGLS